MYNVVLLYIYLHVYVIWYKIKMETGKKKKKKKKKKDLNSGCHGNIYILMGKNQKSMPTALIFTTGPLHKLCQSCHWGQIWPHPLRGR